MSQEIIIKNNHISQRLLALDAVRGLAVTGMFIQHFALPLYSVQFVLAWILMLWLETAIRWFEKKFYQEDKRNDKTAA